MSSTTVLPCDTCKYRKNENPAAHWCSECEEGLCADCYAHHTHSKTSRKHGIITINQYEQLPAFIHEKKHYCNDHDEKYDYFCPAHKTPCCKISSDTEHKNCKGVSSISDIVHGVKKSSVFSEMSSTIENIQHNMDKILKDKETNLKTIHESKIKFQSEIKEIREKLVNLFDKLERKLQDELESIENKIIQQSEDFIKEVTDGKNKVMKIQENIDAIKKHATDFQAFVGMNELKDDVENKKKYLQLLYGDTRLDRINIHCNINEKIKLFLIDLHTFGDIQEERISTKGLFSVNNQDKNVTHEKSKTTESKIQKSRSEPAVKAKVKRTLLVPAGSNKNTITSCAIFPNGKFAFVDGTYNHRIVIMDSTGTSSGEISLSPLFAFDVTCVDNKTIAITTGSSGQIAFANILSKKIKKSIGTTWQCDGITHADGKLIFSVYSKGIHVLHLDTGNISTIHKANITVDTYLTSFGDKIYHTNWKTNSVTCFDMDGNSLWTYEDEKVLQKPRGIAVDSQHNVYVASLGTESIVVISSNGKEGRQLLTKKDGIENVRAIYYDKVNNCLLVCTLSGSAFLFEI
ncbi:Hypothetical predicted protein [Mytilus galloprovincialis]|uniref:B box-type domain-containing protein n=1 Tax=Mytilus galloprovincialis TaxID=29158 RepID=A0A8B6BK93_MYTGA|nr:Hypothetical predicted protein [Mytilus galloprovincialis]